MIDDARPRILFIARAFPPTLGGMETFAFQLSEGLRRHADVRVLANRRGKKALPLFLPYAFAQGVRIARSGRVDAIHLADALLAPVGVAMRAATGKPVTASVCGLDVTWDNALYQQVVPRALERLDLTMPISAATEAALLQRAPRAESMVIPLGVNPLPEPTDADRRRFRELIGRDDARVVLTVGRLVRRKGVAWFVEHVLPSLPANVVYAVIGEGVERERIVAAAAASGVGARLRLLGRVDDGLLSAAYRESDLFVMPNVPVPGDMEGFGLVSLEASASGLYVIAADLEGISEAVAHGRNGRLVAPLDSGAWVREINVALAPDYELPKRAAAFAAHTRREYGWDATARRYLDAIADIRRVRGGGVDVAPGVSSPRSP